MVERANDDCGEVAEGQNAAEADLAGGLEGEQGNGEEVKVIVMPIR